MVKVLVKVNLANQEMRTFDPVPAGTYRVTVDQCEERTSQMSGNANIFWLFRITDVISTQGDGGGAGLIDRTIMHGTSLQESALWNLFRTLVAMGEDPQALQDGEFELEPDAQVGKECVVTVRIRDYQGQPTNNITALRSLTEAEAGALD